MSILDTLRAKLRGGQDDEYYDDEYYGDEGYDEVDEASPRSYDDRAQQGSSNRLLGNPSRPEAESVSVYTRSGKPISTNPAASYNPQQDMRSRASAYASRQEPSGYTPSYEHTVSPNLPTPGDIGLRPVSRTSYSGQLPPYVLRPVSYDDVQSVVRRVRTGQPVVLIFKNTNIEVAKRILDFSFGLSYGLDGAVEEVADRVFAVLPHGISLSQSDLDKLALYTLLRIYSFCIVVWCLSSWITVSNDQFNHVLEGIGKIVEPYLSVFRNVIPPISGVDLSPIVALFVLNLVGRFAISTLGFILI